MFIIQQEDSVLIHVRSTILGVPFIVVWCWHEKADFLQVVKQGRKSLNTKLDGLLELPITVLCTWSTKNYVIRLGRISYSRLLDQNRKDSSRVKFYFFYFDWTITVKSYPTRCPQSKVHIKTYVPHVHGISILELLILVRNLFSSVCWLS